MGFALIYLSSPVDIEFPEASNLRILYTSGNSLRVPTMRMYEYAFFRFRVHGYHSHYFIVDQSCYSESHWARGLGYEVVLCASLTLRMNARQSSWLS